MTIDAHKNFAYSTVATAPSPATSGASLVVASGEGANFPAVPFNAVVCPVGTQPTNANAEIIRVTARSTDTFSTITRAQEGTSARTVVVGDQVFAAVTAKTLTDIEVYPQYGNIVQPYPFILANSGAGTLTANMMYAIRVTIPYSGTLHSLSVLVGAASSGNVDLGIYDTTVTTRTRLYSSGSVACAAASTYHTVDPNLAVSRGDHLDFALACDNGTVSFVRGGAYGIPQMALPSGFIPSPLGGVNKVEWTKASSFPLPSTVAESAFANTASCPHLMAYISPSP